VRSGLTEEGRTKIRAWLPEVYGTAQIALDLFKNTLETHAREVLVYGNFSTLFMGLVTPDGSWEHHGGKLRFTSSEGAIVADQLDPQKYSDFIGESVQTSSYMKSPYYAPLDFPKGIYRVGPLARLNVCERMGVPRGDAELANFKSLGKGAVTSSFLYHYARLIELLSAIEFVERYLDDPELTHGILRADAGINSSRGVGVTEAPRGTLFHDYTVDPDGLLQKVNLIVATGQNNLAMNQTVAQIARAYIHDGKITEPLLNRIEHGIRCYDPCLSCATHAVGQMPLHVRLIGPDGTVVSEIARG
jgi:NAD-reducing hydrogenase large subunit